MPLDLRPLPDLQNDHPKVTRGHRTQKNQTLIASYVVPQIRRSQLGEYGAFGEDAADHFGESILAGADAQHVNWHLARLLPG